MIFLIRTAEPTPLYNPGSLVHLQIINVKQTCGLHWDQIRFGVNSPPVGSRRSALCFDSKQLFITLNPWCCASGNISPTQHPHPSSSSPQGCHTKLDQLFSKKLYIIGLAALVVAVIMVSVGLQKYAHHHYECFHPDVLICFPCLCLDLWDDLHHGTLLWDP